MSAEAEFAELESRLAAALDGIEAAMAAPAAPAEDLSQVLEAERAASAQLQERVNALNSDLADAKAALSARPDLSAKLAERDTEIAALKEAAMQAPAPSEAVDETGPSALLDVVAELRDTAMGDVDPDLINRTLLAEVESLRIARQADLAEMKALLSELDPLLQESADA